MPLAPGWLTHLISTLPTSLLPSHISLACWGLKTIFLNLSSDKYNESETSRTWPLSSWVMPSKLLNASEPQFSQLQHRADKIICEKGLLWRHSGEESVRQSRGHGFGPWFEKIPRATGQLSRSATSH